jgi:hypothetical protein
MIESRDSVEVLSEIPDGETCAACAHVRRCTAFGFLDSPDNRFCSFAPSRFRRPLPDAEMTP